MATSGLQARHIETTVGLSKVVFRLLLRTKCAFSQNPLTSRFVHYLGVNLFITTGPKHWWSFSCDSVRLPAPCGGQTCCGSPWCWLAKSKTIYSNFGPEHKSLQYFSWMLSDLGSRIWKVIAQICATLPWCRWQRGHWASWSRWRRRGGWSRSAAGGAWRIYLWNLIYLLLSSKY